MYIKDTQNYIELEIKTSFQHNSPFDPFYYYKNPQEQHKFVASSMIMITHGITHQQQHLTTATTTTNREFINNSSTTLYFINFE